MIDQTENVIDHESYEVEGVFREYLRNCV
jgi:hypothetical protein